MLSGCVGCCCRLCQGQLYCVGVGVEFSSSTSQPSVFFPLAALAVLPTPDCTILRVCCQNQSSLVKQATLTGHCRVLIRGAGWGLCRLACMGILYLGSSMCWAIHLLQVLGSIRVHRKMQLHE